MKHLSRNAAPARAVVLGKPRCSYCTKAKKLLEDHDIPFISKDVTKSANIMLKRWMDIEGLTTVPQVWLDGTHVGGYDDLKRLLED